MAMDGVEQMSISGYGAAPDVVALNSFMNACSFPAFDNKKAEAVDIAVQLFDEITGESCGGTTSRSQIYCHVDRGAISLKPESVFVLN